MTSVLRPDRSQKSKHQHKGHLKVVHGIPMTHIRVSRRVRRVRRAGDESRRQDGRWTLAVAGEDNTAFDLILSRPKRPIMGRTLIAADCDKHLSTRPPSPLCVHIQDFGCLFCCLKCSCVIQRPPIHPLLRGAHVIRDDDHISGEQRLPNIQLYKPLQALTYDAR